MARRTRTTPTMKTITVGGVSRSYGIVVPTSKAPPGGFPAILTFHGGGTATMTQVQAMASWPKHVAAPVVEVYPLATAQGWAWEPGQTWADDVAFVAALKAEVAAMTVSDKPLVDGSRFFATGISQGGGMAQRIAMARPDLCAGYGVVASAVTMAMMNEAVAPGRRRMIYVNGSADESVPIGWAEQTVNWFASHAGASMGPYVDQGLTGRRRDSDDGAVRQLRVEGGGHVWPATGDVVASAELAAFFEV